ncbi:MAG: nicotinamide mononucleotide transporter [Bacteroidales bacterium]|nr:nicotinamide mononucleotide transporter [Bacteroidales bacterium]
MDFLANISILELLSTLCGLTCVFLAGRGKVLNFWVGYLYNILLFFLFMRGHLYSSMLLQPVSLTINFIGHYRWTHPKEDEANANKELKISVLTWKKRAVYLASITAIALIWGFVLKNISSLWPDVFEPAKNPLLDAATTVLILTAQYLSAQKKLDCWGVWVIVNVSQIILYISVGLVFMPIVSAIYLVLAFFGFAGWRKQLKTQDNAAN